MGGLAQLTAQNGYDYNGPQLVVGGAMAIGIFATGILLGRFISRGRGGGALVATLVVTLTVTAIWIYGFSAWCSGCGAP